jgi:predicted enzyme related to lactoylglutathione lyase
MANHPIVHIDIPAINGKDSAEFYAKTFDWKLEHAPEFDYWQFAAEGGPGGGFMQAGEQGATINQLVVYIGTDDIEGSLASVEANGGKTILPKTEIPGIGWYAIFSDPVGNSLALYKSMT